MRMYVRFGLLLAVMLALLVLLPSPEGAFGTPTGVPDSMDSLGDSMTQAMDADGIPAHFGDQPWYSWSTGDSSAVESQYYRIRHSYSPITGHNYNDAVSGAKMAALNGQAQTAVNRHVEYVTILMGANDVCTSSEAGMTSVTAFHDQFVQAMDTLTTGLPDAYIFVASIPDIYQLWYVLHGNPSARAAWNYGICQSLLANPNPDPPDPEAEARRLRVRQRNIDFNTVLSQVCASYPQHCRFDNNAIFDGGIVASQVSTLDYFHPSITGQANIANVTWAATYGSLVPVGGVAELPDVSDSSHPDYVVVAVLAGAALAALGAGGWYARRRRLG